MALFFAMQEDSHRACVAARSCSRPSPLGTSVAVTLHAVRTPDMSFVASLEFAGFDIPRIVISRLLRLHFGRVSQSPCRSPPVWSLRRTSEIVGTSLFLSYRPSSVAGSQQSAVFLGAERTLVHPTLCDMKLRPFHAFAGSDVDSSLVARA